MSASVLPCDTSQQMTILWKMLEMQRNFTRKSGTSEKWDRVEYEGKTVLHFLGFCDYRSAERTRDDSCGCIWRMLPVRSA